MDWLKSIVLKWLGIDRVFSDMYAIRSGISVTQDSLDTLIRNFNDQMAMVGTDVTWFDSHGKRDKDMIIFVSRLGQHGNGTVRIVGANFRDYRELVDFMRRCEDSFPNRTIIDTPFDMRKFGGF